MIRYNIHARNRERLRGLGIDPIPCSCTACDDAHAKGYTRSLLYFDGDGAIDDNALKLKLFPHSVYGSKRPRRNLHSKVSSRDSDDSNGTYAVKHGMKKRNIIRQIETRSISLSKLVVEEYEDTEHTMLPEVFEAVSEDILGEPIIPVNPHYFRRNDIPSRFQQDPRIQFRATSRFQPLVSEEPELAIDFRRAASTQPTANFQLVDINHPELSDCIQPSAILDSDQPSASADCDQLSASTDNDQPSASTADNDQPSTNIQPRVLIQTTLDFQPVPRFTGMRVVVPEPIITRHDVGVQATDPPTRGIISRLWSWVSGYKPIRQDE